MRIPTRLIRLPAGPAEDDTPETAQAPSGTTSYHLFYDKLANGFVEKRRVAR